MPSNVGLVGWNSKNATEALLPTGETAAVAATAAVLSCEGRQSRNDSTSPTRGAVSYTHLTLPTIYSV